MLVRALSSDCMVERYSVSLKETCGKRKFSVLEAREFIHVRLHFIILKIVIAFTTTITCKLHKNKIS